jgi:hypothetical protein
MDVKAPAEPRTPSMATLTAERRCVEVGLVREDSGVVGSAWNTALNNEVGRAIITTPRREIRDAYCAERGNGSRRKRVNPKAKWKTDDYHYRKRTTSPGLLFKSSHLRMLSVSAMDPLFGWRHVMR